MKCSECGKGRLKLAVADVTTTFRGENISVKARVEACGRCGFQVVRGEDMGEFSLLVADEYRRKHELLTSVEIKERRGKLGMSQEAFARYLGVGIASVKRWELGLIQDRAMNELLLLKTDPEAAEVHARTLRRKLSELTDVAGQEVELDMQQTPRAGSWRSPGRVSPPQASTDDFAHAA